MNYTIQQIALATNGNLFLKIQTSINHIFIDSRNFITSSDSLFIAIKGTHHNGHHFIKELINKGIINFLVSKLPEDFEELSQANFVLVHDTLQAFHELSFFHRKKFNFPVLAITGSYGKTIVKEWLAFLLHTQKNIVRSPKSFNSQIGVPLSLILFESSHEIALIEAGISQKREMEKLKKIIAPDIGLITNIGDAHSENFESIHQKICEKIKLFENSDTIIFCKDHQDILKPVLSTFSANKIFSWAKNSDADVRIQKITKLITETQITLTFKDTDFQICIPFMDEASIENAIHCFATIAFLNLLFPEVIDNFRNLPSIESRLEIKKGINNCIIINDSYSTDIPSLKIAINCLLQHSGFKKNTLIISDYFSNSTNNDVYYSELALLIKQAGINRIIGIGESLIAHAEKFDLQKHFFRTPSEFIRNYSLFSFQNETVLIKTIKNIEYDSINQLLQIKNHRTVLEVNLEAMVQNLNFYKSLLLPETKIMVMVKAFSYGSGSVEIANLLQHQKADYLGVAFTDEGVELRRAGITLPIMVMNPDADNFSNLITYHLEPEIFSLPLLMDFHLALIKLGKEQYPIHLKLDSGMHRSGITENELPPVIDFIKKNKKLIVKSIFSHLAGSEDPNLDYFTHEQAQNFMKYSKIISSELGYFIERHLLNSAGIERFPQYQFDMVRLGIGFYGISSTNQDKLRCISTLKTKIAQIKTISNQETIGYNRKGTLNKDSVIATISIGYADGLNRKLGNRNGAVMVKGRLAPYIGNISMDICSIDITGIDAKEGEDVIIFGDEYPVFNLAKQLGTISYEILAGISQRVKRVYYQ